MGSGFMAWHGITSRLVSSDHWLVMSKSASNARAVGAATPAGTACTRIFLAEHVTLLLFDHSSRRCCCCCCRF
jgi:hypothetical protein